MTAPQILPFDDPFWSKFPPPLVYWRNSDDGRQWRRDNRVCIQCGAEVAYNQSEACPHERT